MQSKVSWAADMLFCSENRGLKSQMDTSAEFGGKNLAPSPKESVLNAMCACSGMDVVILAKKMRLGLSSLSMEATAEKTKTTPSYFASVHVKYYLEGSGAEDKLVNTVVLSMTKYCGVSYMISQVCPITYEIFINGKAVYNDQARFNLEAME